MSDNTNEVKTWIAANVKEVRTARGWSQGELAKQAGVSRAMITQIEAATTNATATLLGKLSAAFRISITDLVRQPGEMAVRISHGDGPTYEDPLTGCIRTVLSPPSSTTLQLLSLIHISEPTRPY